MKNGIVYQTAKTIANALELTRKLMKKYNILASNVIRHFDVNGKSCPAYWCGNTAKNNKWNSEFHGKLTSAVESSTSPSGSFLVKVLVSNLTIRAGAGVNTKAVGAITDKGTYTITEVKYNGKTPWGKLKSGKGYISLVEKYCKRL